MKFTLLLAITLATTLSLSSCEAPVATAKVSEDLFPQALLTDFLEWESVMPDEESFESVGHGGPLVRGYFNATAEGVYHGEADFPFPEGAVLAKAVIADAGTPSAAASRVYFMKKMPAGYDEANSNWAYGYANRQSDGTYEYNASQGAVASCISCHAGQTEYDYARTVKFYRDSH